MLTSNKAPLLRRMRVRYVVNHNPRDIKKGSLVILNFKSLQNAKAKLGPIDINRNNLITRTYAEKKINMKVYNKFVIQNLLPKRDETYGNITKELPFLKGINEGMLNQGYNLVYSLDHANAIFEANTAMMPKINKPAYYWDFINSYMNETVKNYPIKTMIVNVEEWADTVLDGLSNTGNVFNPVAYLYRLMKVNQDAFFNIGDLDIILTFRNDCIRVNPKECLSLKNRDKNINLAAKFRTELFKLMNKKDPEENDSSVSRIEKELTPGRVNTMTVSILRNYTGGATGELSDEAIEKIADQVAKTMEKQSKEEGTEIDEEKVMDEVDKDETLIKEICKQTTYKPSVQSASSKRDQLLREKQLDIKVKDKSLRDIIEVSSQDAKIEENDVSASVDTFNANMTKVRFPNINKSYEENLFQKDLTNIFLDLNNKSLPIYLRSIKVNDSSNLSNYKDTYTVELEDELRVRHHLTFDVPKLIDNRFLYLGGNRKYINNQQLLLPIAKTAPDTVQLVSATYNKIFIRRYGDKVSSLNEKLKKALGNPIEGVRIVNGKFDENNKEFITTIDYDDLSKMFKEITINGTKLSFFQEEIRKHFNDNTSILNNEAIINILPIGFKGRDYFVIDLNTNTVVKYTDMGKGKDYKAEDTNMNLIDFMVSLSPKLNDALGGQSAGKKYMYNRATIMTKQVPIVLLLSFFDGIDQVMRRANVKHFFSDSKPRLASDETAIQFADGYLVFSNKPFESALLMNGLLDVPTENYRYEDFNDKFVFQSLFETMFGRRDIANAFANFKDNFIDAITLDTLQRMNLPEDITGMILHANSLLADNQYTPETDARLYRIRSVEIINALLAKQIAKAYERYKATAHLNNPKKISIRKDALLKDIMMQQIVEDYSELNPVTELQKLHGSTKKGPMGCNLAQAYTQQQRSFSKSMTGLFTMSSSPDANVGVQRVMTLDAPIMDARGFIDNKAMDGKMDNLTDANLFGPAELLTPLGVQRDDSIRTAMSTKQSTHLTPIVKSSPTLVSNGMEKVVPYHLSKDWSFIAKEDGKVVEYDEKNKLYVVEYKSGETEAITIGNRIAKNGAGGFCLTKELIPHYKLGESFKKNDILAHDRDFFGNSDIHGTRFKVGSLQKVALLSSAATYEDSSYITKKVSRDMASEIVMIKPATLGANTTVDYIAKVGDRVESGDELIRFERSFDEDNLNMLLGNIGMDLKEEIAMSGKDKVKSKYTGIIEDIKIYSTVELEELSPSLRKIVNGYYNQIKNRKKVLDKYDKNGNELMKCGLMFNEPTAKVETNNGKFRGEIVNDGVLIEFYIRVHDECSVGDKITFFSALKSVVGVVIPEGLEGYSLHRPEEEIGAVISCNSINKIVAYRSDSI